MKTFAYQMARQLLQLPYPGFFPMAARLMRWSGKTTLVAQMYEWPVGRKTVGPLSVGLLYSAAMTSVSFRLLHPRVQMLTFVQGETRLCQNRYDAPSQRLHSVSSTAG